MRNLSVTLGGQSEQGRRPARQRLFKESHQQYRVPSEKTKETGDPPNPARHSKGRRPEGSTEDARLDAVPQRGERPVTYSELSPQSNNKVETIRRERGGEIAANEAVEEMRVDTGHRGMREVKNPTKDSSKEADVTLQGVTRGGKRRRRRIVTKRADGKGALNDASATCWAVGARRTPKGGQPVKRREVEQKGLKEVTERHENTSKQNAKQARRHSGPERGQNTAGKGRKACLNGTGKEKGNGDHLRQPQRVTKPQKRKRLERTKKKDVVQSDCRGLM